MDTTAEPVQTAPETQQMGAETATPVAAPAAHTPSEAQPELTAAERHKQVQEKLSASIREQVAADAKPKVDEPPAPKADEPNPQPDPKEDGQPKPGEQPAEDGLEPEGAGKPKDKRVRYSTLSPLMQKMVDLAKADPELGRDADALKREACKELGLPMATALEPPQPTNEPAPPDDGKPKEPRTVAEIEARIAELEAQDLDDFDGAALSARTRELARLEARHENALAREADEQARAQESAQQARDRLEQESLDQLIAEYPEVWDAKAGDWAADSPLLEAAQAEYAALVKADPSKATDPLANELCVERAARKLGIAPQRGKAPAKPTASAPKQPEAPQPPAAPLRTAPPLGGATNGTPTQNNGGLHTREDIAASKLPPAEKHRLTRQLIASSLREAA